MPAINKELETVVAFIGNHQPVQGDRELRRQFTSRGQVVLRHLSRPQLNTDGGREVAAVSVPKSNLEAVGCCDLRGMHHHTKVERSHEGGWEFRAPACVPAAAHDVAQAPLDLGRVGQNRPVEPHGTIPRNRASASWI